MVNYVKKYDIEAEDFRGKFEEDGASCEAAALISYDNQTILYCRPSPEAGYEAMEKILASKQLPDAVYITASTLAFGALRCCRDRAVLNP